MDTRTEIKDFLQSRRARLTPESSGLGGYGQRRRVPGLRREEVAYLADISVDYYARMERGDVSGVSDSVLQALARALQLDETETEHLQALVRAAQPITPGKPRPQAASTVRPGVQAILDAFENAPAWVSNQRMDFVAGNRLGRALYSDMLVDPDARRNNARYVFFSTGASEFYTDWDQAADDVVAVLRHYAALHAGDRRLMELLGELSAKSEAFRVKWAVHKIRFHRTGSKRMVHPLVGELDLAYERLLIPGDDNLSLFVHPVQAGTDAADRLALLASWAPIRGLDERGASHIDR